VKRFLFLCEDSECPAELARAQYNHQYHLSHKSGKRNIYLTAEPFKRLALLQSPLAQDLIRIAAYVYVADTTVSRGGEKDILLKNWERHFTFVVPVSSANYNTWNGKNVRKSLENTLSLLTGDTYTFHFVKGYVTQNDLLFKPSDQHEIYGDVAVLFSGGVDSLYATLRLLEDGKRPLLVSHTPRSSLQSLQGRLLSELKGYSHHHLNQFGARIHRKGKPAAKEHTQRSRGFLYLSLGCALALDLRLDSVVLADNGVVSLNLAKLEESVGTKNSRATWPPFLQAYKKLIAQIADVPIDIANPLQFMTRAETMSSLQKLGAERLLEYTVSCAHTRETTGRQPHCGICSQCIDRRFGSIAAGLEEYDPAERYRKNIFTESLDEGTEIKLALGHTRFAREVIQNYGKSGESLFSRWPELNDIVSTYNPTDQGHVAKSLTTLLARHSLETLGVLTKEFQRHRTAIENWEIPSTSLLALENNPGIVYEPPPARPLKESVAFALNLITRVSRAEPKRVRGYAPMLIFLSSVFQGMMALRSRLKSSIESSFEGEFKLLTYESEPAESTTPENAIRKMIEDSTMYVALFDVRSGSNVPGDKELSITALEYRIARESGLPRLVFVSPERKGRDPTLQSFLDNQVRDFGTGVKYSEVDFADERSLIREVRRAILRELKTGYAPQTS